MQKVIALVFVICFLGQSIFLLASYFDCFEREKLYSAGLDAYLKEDYHSAVNLYTKALRENRFTGKKDELYAKQSVVWAKLITLSDSTIRLNH